MSLSLHRTNHFRAAALLMVLLLIIGLVWLFPPNEWLPLKQWGASLEAAGFEGMVAFVLLGLLATSVGLPRQLIAFVAGLAYGVLSGLILALFAALAGCYLTICLSRRFFFPYFSQRYPGFVKQLDRLLKHDVFLKVIALRLQPLGTNLLTNACIGLTEVPRHVFLLASGIGYVPQMLVFALLGAGVRVESDAQLLLSAVLLLISVLLGLLVLYLHRARRNIEDR